jgi:hypothetical protein
VTLSPTISWTERTIIERRFVSPFTVLLCLVRSIRAIPRKASLGGAEI